MPPLVPPASSVWDIFQERMCISPIGGPVRRRAQGRPPRGGTPGGAEGRRPGPQDGAGGHAVAAAAEGARAGGGPLCSERRALASHPGWPGSAGRRAGQCPCPRTAQGALGWGPGPVQHEAGRNRPAGLDPAWGAAWLTRVFSGGRPPGPLLSSAHRRPRLPPLVLLRFCVSLGVRPQPPSAVSLRSPRSQPRPRQGLCLALGGMLEEAAETPARSFVSSVAACRAAGWHSPARGHHPAASAGSRGPCESSRHPLPSIIRWWKQFSPR